MARSNLGGLIFFERLRPYVTTLLFVGMGTSLQWAMSSFTGRTPYIIFFPVVVLSTLLGVGPLGILLSILSIHYFFTPPVAMEGVVVRHFIFAASAFLVYFLGRSRTRVIRQLEAVFQSVNDGITVCDMNGKFLMANDAQSRIYGSEDVLKDVTYIASICEVRDMNGKCLTVPEWPISRVLHGESLENLELVVKRTDNGREWYMSYSGRPIKSPDGKHDLAMLVSRDITEQKTIERALKASEEHFRTLADLIPQHAWIADAQGVVQWCNRRWYEYVGVSLEEVLASGIQSIHHPDKWPSVEEAWSNSIKTGLPFEMTFPILGMDGNYRWFLTRVQPLKDEQGRVVRWFGTNTDVDDQKRIMQDLSAALNARDEFLSIASHELKTPLTLLKLQAQVVNREAHRGATVSYSNEQIDRLVHQTEKQVNRLTKLVDDMLDVSRIRTGKLSMDPEDTDLGELVQETIQKLAPAMQAAGTPPKFTLRSTAHGKWDRMRIEQVVINLLTNAMRYGEKRPVSVQLERRDDRAVLCVRDEGIGLREESRDRIFERFERVGSGNQGLGLGLYISRQIVTAHGGRIWAESPGPGQGTAFYVELPLAT